MELLGEMSGNDQPHTTTTTGSSSSGNVKKGMLGVTALTLTAAENLAHSPMRYPRGGSSSWSRSPRIQPSSFPLPQTGGQGSASYHPDDTPGKERILHKSIPSFSISRSKNNAVFWKIVEAKSSILPGPFEYTISDTCVGNFGSNCQKPPAPTSRSRRVRRGGGTLPRSERPTDQYMGWTPPGPAHYCPGVTEPSIPKVGTHFRHKYGHATWFGKPLLENPHTRSQWLIPKAPTSDVITSLGGGREGAATTFSLHSLWEDTICAVEADLNKVVTSMNNNSEKKLPPRAPTSASSTMRVASAAAARSALSSRGSSLFEALERPLSAATPTISTTKVSSAAAGGSPSSGTGTTTRQQQREASVSPSKASRPVTPSTVLNQSYSGSSSSSSILSPVVAGGGISRSRRDVSELPSTCHVTPGPGDYDPSYAYSNKKPALWEEDTLQSPLLKHRAEVRKSRKVPKPLDRFFYLP